MAKTLAHRGIKKPDVAEIIAMIEAGISYREIAAKYSVSVSVVYEWVRAPEWAEHSARALASSAESWLDRGLAELEKSTPEGAARARYIAHECARRAGIRNMHYRERVAVDANVSGNLTVQLVNFADLPDTDPEPVDT